MKKFFNVLDSDSIIVEKTNVSGNKYYVEESIYSKNKRIKIVDFKKSIMHGNFQEINEDLLKQAKNVYIDLGILYLEFYKETNVIKYKYLDIDGIIQIIIPLELFSANEINMFRSFIK